MENPIQPKKGLSTGMKILVGCGGLIVLGVVCFVLFTALGLAGASKVADEVDKQTQESASKEDEAFNNPAKLNEPVVVKDVQWTVIEAKDLGSTLKSKYGEFGTDCVASSGTFIQVKVKIKNNSKELQSVTDLNIYDSEKNEFTTSSDVFECVDDELFILDNINPGIEKTFVGVYEVPSTSKNFKVKLGDLDLFSNEHKYVSLGF